MTKQKEKLRRAHRLRPYRGEIKRGPERKRKKRKVGKEEGEIGRIEI